MRRKLRRNRAGRRDQPTVLTLHVRVHTSQRAQVQAAARAEGVTVSAWLRRAVQARLDDAHKSEPSVARSIGAHRLAVRLPVVKDHWPEQRKQAQATRNSAALRGECGECGARPTIEEATIEANAELAELVGASGPPKPGAVRASTSLAAPARQPLRPPAASSATVTVRFDHATGCSARGGTK